MNLASRLVVFFGLPVLILANPSCKQEEKARKKDGAATSTRTNTNTDKGDGDDDDDGGSADAAAPQGPVAPADPCSANPSAGGTTPSSSSSTATAGDTSTGTLASTGTDTGGSLALRARRSHSSHRAGLHLQGDVTYDGGIKTILQSKCVQCHGPSSAPGDLSTYSAVKSAAGSIEASISAGRMPPRGSQALTAAEKTMLAEWVAAGAPETGGATGSTDTDEDTGDETDPATGTDADGGGATSTDPCAPPEDTAGPDETLDELFADLLGENERKECAARGLLFDRKTKVCQEGVSLAKDYPCTREGVIGKFTALKTPGIDKIVDKYISEGFTVDQCGERDGKPVINFYKRVDAGDGEAVLQTKYICTNGDPLCARN